VELVAGFGMAYSRPCLKMIRGWCRRRQWHTQTAQ